MSLEAPITSTPPGSRVMVTGANGLLASHICLQLLERGFNVRGAVRDTAQSSWLLEGRFKAHADRGAIELVSVPDFGVKGAYDEAIKGASAIIHTAYVTNIVPDPHKVITPMVVAIDSILNAAMREPSVKGVVFTSSAIAASPLLPHIDNGNVDRNSWNEAALEAASAPPPFGASHAMANYPASKVAAEKEIWKVVDQHQDGLHFNVNVVSPAGLIGEPLNEKHVEGQANWVVHAYRGNKAVMDALPATFYADVKDVALIHVAALLDPKVKLVRLQSWGHSAHWNEILAILRKRRPHKQFLDDYAEPYHLKVSVDQSESLALLEKWSKDPEKRGWTSLEDCVAENINNPYLVD
ncbi:putative aldehyde reductase 2 [Immersiella caudata]|uniref:Aldehyde reductase 2 n=1 Tax=Immersiella caudata TaxID=314043 RepID=A0AA40BZX7_9PEZI|nr:putative aldehyde reductase 2 [Immersiella caudata]